MRASLVVAVLLLPLLPGAAQGQVGVLEDAEGDVVLEGVVLGQPAPAPAPSAEAASHADLLSLGVAETEDDVTFVLSVASLEGDRVVLVLRVLFSRGGEDYVVEAVRFSMPAVGSDSMRAYLYRVTAEGWYERVSSLEAATDAAAGVVSIPVPRAFLMDQKGEPPARGDALEGLRVEAESWPIHFGVAATSFADRMPDEESDAASWSFALGDHSQGNLRLRATERVRVSNGGSTTFVFPVTLENLGETESEYELAVLDVPAGWNVTVRSPVKVPGGDERTVTVLASVPFAHDHGGFTSFNLTAQGRSDPGSQGRMRLGVLHTPIPQPAGHHNELFLHSRGRVSNPVNDAFGHVEPYGRGFLNTVSDHEGETPYATPNWWDDGATWELPLDPALRMGLDFDVEGKGALHLTLDNAPPVDAELRAELVLLGPNGEETTLAASEKSAVTFEANQPLTLDLPLTPTEESDYVPHQPGQSLVLLLDLDGFSWTPGAVPRLRTEDFKLTLPLNEYHDKLTGAAEAGAVLDLVADGPVEKAGRPGTLVTYLFTLRNAGSTEETVEIDLAGADGRHATLVPSAPVTLGPGATRAVTVGVSIPSDAAEGEELEVLVFAHGVDDPAKTAVARTKTRVSLGSDAVPDESPVLISAREAERPSPGPGALALLAALAALALAFRPRRPKEASAER